MESIRDPPITLRDTIERDEALLRAAAPTVRVAVLREAGVSIGLGSPRDGSAEANAQRFGLPTVRRSTGGTGILHLPGDLVWSVVLPRSDARVGADFSSAYGRLGAGLVAYLAELGLEGRWMEPEGLSDEFCLLGPRGQALSVGGRVLGGAAQHVTASALLHHGVVARTLDRGLIERIFGLTVGLTGAKLTALTELGVAADPEALADGLVRALAGSFAGGRPS
jgi:lipoate---protein ligase